MTTLSRSGRVLAVAVVAFVLLAVGLPVSSASAGAGDEAQFVDLINRARASSGKGGLTTNGELTSIARRWAQHMADDQRLSHNPNLANEVTQDWEKLAENVGFGQDVGQIHDAFMNSAPHRANILDGALTHVGVGVVVDGSGQMWVTEVFMRLRGGGGGGGGGTPPTTAAPSPPPTAAPQPTAPAPTSPPTTRAPRVTTPTTARPTPAPTTPPESTAPPVTEAPPTTVPPVEPAAPAAAAPTPTMRLVLVLGGLHDLDQGR